MRFRPEFPASRLLVWLLIVLVIGACSRRRSAPLSPPENPSNQPDQESWGVVYRMDQGGDRRLRIEAGHMERFEDQDSTYAIMRSPGDTGRVHAWWYNESGALSAKLTSNELIYFESENRMRSEGDVVVTTPTEKRIETERLFWNGSTRQIRAPGFVRIVTLTERIQGYELKADEAFDNYRLARVTGKVEIQEEGS